MTSWILVVSILLSPSQSTISAHTVSSEQVCYMAGEMAIKKGAIENYICIQNLGADVVLDNDQDYMRYEQPEYEL